MLRADVAEASSAGGVVRLIQPTCRLREPVNFTDERGETLRMRMQYIPGRLLSFMRPGYEASQGQDRQLVALSINLA